MRVSETHDAPSCSECQKNCNRGKKIVVKITVAKNLGFLYTASRYTFSPTERGIIVPNSNQTKRPQKDSTNPRAQSIREAPTELTDASIDDGVEKNYTANTGIRRAQADKNENNVQLNTPRCRPIPPATSRIMCF